MRKHTDPGLAPPAPGSVCPPVKPVPPSAQVAQVDSGWTDPDDVPTKPDCVDPDTLALVRLIGDMAKIEKRKVVQLLTHWTRCGLGRRVLIEELARELAIGEKHV